LLNSPRSAWRFDAFFVDRALGRRQRLRAQTHGGATRPGVPTNRATAQHMVSEAMQIASRRQPGCCPEPRRLAARRQGSRGQPSSLDLI
jgi:hypothetical protein